MKKTWLYKMLVAVSTTSLLLSGCTSLDLNPQQATINHPLTKKNLTRRKTNHSYKNNRQDNNSSIALDDFSNLNISLNNQQVTQGNLWEKIGDGFKIADQENRPEVQAQIRWFMAHPGYLQRTTERARAYLFIVYQEVKSRNLPTELVLLPINESGYYPFSYSVAGATGIWQLMPGTANDYGLKHNFWYDGRRDIFDSTNAALDYLTYLANYFNGDWLLAIAAYDTGEGNVQNAIARNLREGKATDFWSLRLAAETRSYVPRLLALAAIISHPDRYPVQLPVVDAKPVVASVHLDKQIKLSDAARFAGISVNQLKVLNPGLSKTTTDPSGDSKLLLPIDSIEGFKANVRNLAPEPTENTQTFGRYRVQRGDTLQSIADRFGISVADIRQENNLLGRRAVPGSVLLIPNVTENYKPNTNINLDQASLNLSNQSNTTTTANTNNAAVNKTVPNNTMVDPDKTSVAGDKFQTRHGTKHRVQKGETLSKIAAKYHVSMSQLEQLNPDIKHKPLRPGQVINLSESDVPIATDQSSSNDKSVTKVTKRKTHSKPHHPRHKTSKKKNNTKN